MENTLRFLRIYIESLTMSSQEPLKGPKQGGGELMWTTRSAPPVILCLLRACISNILYSRASAGVEGKELGCKVAPN